MYAAGKSGSRWDMARFEIVWQNLFNSQSCDVTTSRPSRSCRRSFSPNFLNARISNVLSSTTIRKLRFSSLEKTAFAAGERFSTLNRAKMMDFRPDLLNGGMNLLSACLPRLDKIRKDKSGRPFRIRHFTMPVLRSLRLEICS